MAEERVQRRLAAIMAADVVGYSRLMGVDEAATLAALKAHRKELVDAKIAEHQGRIVKLIGDGMLVEFTSVVNAVACAAEIQSKMRERNADVPDERRIEFRIGINLGDIIFEDNDIYGDGVNVAARLESIAKPGGISVSASVREHVGNRLDIVLEDTGEQILKNIERPVRVYRVTLGPSTTMAAIGASVDEQHPNALNDTMRAELEQARDCYRRRAWADAFAAFSHADQESRLGAEDLERLAMAAYLTNRNDDCLAALPSGATRVPYRGGARRRRPCRFLAGLPPRQHRARWARATAGLPARTAPGAGGRLRRMWLRAAADGGATTRAGDWDGAFATARRRQRSESGSRTPIWWPARCICKGAR